MGQAGCREQCASTIGLTEKECRDCFSEVHQAEFSTDFYSEDHHSDLQVSKTIQLVDVPADDASKKASLEQQHKDLELWWKQQQEQELNRVACGGGADPEKLTGDARDHGRQRSLDCDSQAPLLGPLGAAARSPRVVAATPHEGSPPPHEGMPPAPHDGVPAAALSPAGLGAEKSPGGSVPSTDWATKSAQSASRAARLDSNASWCDEDLMADLGTERVARRPQSMDSPRIKTASGLPRRDSRSPRRLPSAPKGERWHSQLDNFTCELTGYRRRPIVVSARRARRMQREQEREACVLTAPVPHPQPAVPKREYKPPPPLRQSLLHRPEFPPAAAANEADPRPAASTAKPLVAGGFAPAASTAKPLVAGGFAPAAPRARRDSSGGSSSSSDAGPRSARPPSIGWTSLHSPAVTGKCRPSSRARPAVPALPSLSPENLRKEATRGRSAGPAVQGAVGAQATQAAKPGFGLGGYFAAAGMGSTQGAAAPGEGNVSAVTVSGTQAASEPARAAKVVDDDDLVVTLDAAIRNLEQAENSVYGKAFSSLGGGGGGNVAAGSKPLREFLLQQTSLQGARMDQELARVATGGSLARQGFVQLLREHAAARDAVEEAFHAAAAGAASIKPASRCRVALQQAACNQLGVQLPKPKWDKIFQVVMRDIKELDAQKWSEVCSLLFRIVRLAKYAKL